MESNRQNMQKYVNVGDVSRENHHCKVQSVGTYMFKQTFYALLELEQSDQGLHCLPFHLNLFGHSTS